MKRRIVSIIVLVVLSIGLLLTACSGESKSKAVEGKNTSAGNIKSTPGVSNSKTVEGKYEGSIGYFQLNKDGTFLLSNGLQITGKYTISGEDIEFDCEKMNGQELGTITKGKFKGDYLIGPEGVRYTKSQ